MVRRVACCGLLVLAACGPTRAGSMIVDAAAELAAARTAEAEGKAPYEFTAAEEYLHKARHDHSYANFETAEKFAKKARDCAKVARFVAEDRTRTELGATAAGLPRGTKCRAGVRLTQKNTDEPPDPSKPAPLPEGDAP